MFPGKCVRVRESVCSSGVFAVVLHMQVQELDLSGCNRLGSENFPLVALCCPNLQVLRMIGCSQVLFLFARCHSCGRTGSACTVMV